MTIYFKLFSPDLVLFQTHFGPGSFDALEHQVQTLWFLRLFIVSSLPHFAKAIIHVFAFVFGIYIKSFSLSFCLVFALSSLKLSRIKHLHHHQCHAPSLTQTWFGPITRQYRALGRDIKPRKRNIQIKVRYFQMIQNLWDKNIFVSLRKMMVKTNVALSRNQNRNFLGNFLKQ